MILLLGKTDKGFAANVLNLNDTAGTVSLDKYFDLLEDRQGALTIQDIQDEGLDIKWQPNEIISPNFGVTKSVYWLRIKIINNDLEYAKAFLTISNPFLDDITLYEYHKTKKVREIRTGELLPFNYRDVPHHHFVFELVFHPDSEKTVLIRIHTNGVMDFPITLSDTRSFIEKTKLGYIGNGIFFAILASLLIYNFFLFFSIRERVYFYYVLYLFSLLILNLSATGFANEFLWPGIPLWGDRATNIFVALSLICAGLFIRQYLNLKNFFTVWDQVIIYYIVMISILGIVSIFVKYPTMIYLYASLIPGAILALGLGIASLKKNIGGSGYYLFAWLVLIIGAVIRMLKALGFLNSTFITENSLAIGSTLEVLLFSFGLADKINQEKKAKIVALYRVNELLENMEDKVKERTLELSKAKQRADFENRQKDKFVAIVSHDLRSPLSGVMHLLQGIQKNRPRLSPEQFDNQLELCANSLAYSLDMTEKILNVNKIDSGKVTLSFTLISLQETLNSLKEELTPELINKNILVNIGEIEEDIITADYSLLTQILRNLISNAIKFSFKKSAIEIYAYLRNNEVAITVKDYGQGIASDILPHLFDKSHKSHKPGTAGEMGHGLGLSYCDDFAKLLNGRITAANNTDAGACFTLWLPHNEKTMIIADDGDNYREALSKIFRSHGWLVIEAGNGNEILQTLAHLMPDVIITDKNMPEIDGLTVIETISKNSDYDEIVIFLLSSDFSSENVSIHKDSLASYSDKIAGLIPRFESPDKIFRIVQSHLGKS